MAPLEEADVAVFGGGVAGTMAAVAAGRSGARVRRMAPKPTAGTKAVRSAHTHAEKKHKEQRRKQERSLTYVSCFVLLVPTPWVA